MALYIRIYGNLTPFGFYLGTLSPFIPLPLSKGKGEGYIREASPLFDSPLVSLSLIRRGRFIIEEGLTPLLDTPHYQSRARKGEPLNMFTGSFRGTKSL